VVSADEFHVIQVWLDDFSGRSLEEILTIEGENRAWNKKLRQEYAALVDSRLAKQITQEEYTVRRQGANADAAECKRQRTTLVNEIRSRHDTGYERSSGMDLRK
jgi:hypothetical protein